MESDIIAYTLFFFLIWSHLISYKAPNFNLPFQLSYLSCAILPRGCMLHKELTLMNPDSETCENGGWHESFHIQYKKMLNKVTKSCKGSADSCAREQGLLCSHLCRDTWHLGSQALHPLPPRASSDRSIGQDSACVRSTEPFHLQEALGNSAGSMP